MIVELFISGSCGSYCMHTKGLLNLNLSSLDKPALVGMLMLFSGDLINLISCLKIYVVLEDDLEHSFEIFEALKTIDFDLFSTDIFLSVYSSRQIVYEDYKYDSLIYSPSSLVYICCECCGCFFTKDIFNHHANVEICHFLDTVKI